MMTISYNTKIIAFILVLFALFVSDHARAHSWYDHDCCSDRDCAPVQSHRFLSSPDPTKLGQLEVTIIVPAPYGLPGTQTLTAVVDDETKRRDSKDAKVHACIYPGQKRVMCIYLPPGN